MEPSGGRPLSFADHLRRAFTENLGLKALSLAAALALFSLVRVPQGADAESRRTFMVDVITTVDVPPGAGKTLVTDFPPAVRVTLQGSRFLLASIDREELQTDITLADPDQTLRFFEPRDFPGIPAGVSIVEIEPASVPLTWDNEMARTLRVEAVLTGEVAAGLAVTRPVRVEPPTVRVSGPQRDLPSELIRAAPVSLDGLGPGEHRRTVGLPFIPGSVTAEPTEVDVVLEVQPELQTRTIEDVEIIAVGPAEVELRPHRVDLILIGPPGSISSLDEETVIPTVDAAEPGLTGTIERQVQVRGLPDGVVVESIEPSVVFLTLIR